MRRSVLILLVGTIISAHAQEKREALPSTNTVFLEGLGQAIFWSANFEHTEYANERLGFHFRLGVGAWSTKKVPSFIALPITFSLSYGDIHRAEAGFGFLFYSYGGTGHGALRTSETLMPSGTRAIGFRRNMAGSSFGQA